jgi:hypothetical protein
MPPRIAGTSTAARQVPPTRSQLVQKLAGFIAEQIGAVGGVTEDALLAAGFEPETVEDLGPDVRKALRGRGVLAAAA